MEVGGWVGGSRSHSEFFFFFVYTLLKVVNYYDLSVQSMSVMGFQKKV